MAKKNSRSEKPVSPSRPAAPAHGRMTRATTRKSTTTPDVIVAEPDGFPAVAVDTAYDMKSQGDGSPDTRTPTYQEIAEAAYRRYLERGGSHGQDFDDWLEAERTLWARK